MNATLEQAESALRESMTLEVAVALREHMNHVNLDERQFEAIREFCEKFIEQVC